MEKDIDDRIREAYNNFCNVLGIDPVLKAEEFKKRMNEDGKLRINTDFWSSKYLLEANNYMCKGRCGDALVVIVDNIRYFMDIANIRSIKEVMNGDHHNQYEYYDALGDIYGLFEEYKNTTFKHFIDRYRSAYIFEEGELDNGQIMTDIPVQVDRVINSNVFNTYKYIDSGDKLHYDDEIFIYPEIGISSDIGSWLRFLKTQAPYVRNQKNKIVVTLYLKLDEVEPMFSSFLMTIHKGYSVWIATDQENFKNPGNREKQARRGRSSGKLRESFYDKSDMIDLPYRIIHDLDEIRGKHQGVTIASNFEKIKLDKNIGRIMSMSSWDKKNTIKNIAEGVKLANDALAEKGIYPSAHRVHYNNSFNEAGSITFKIDGFTCAFYDHSEDHILLYKSPEILKTKVEDLHTYEKFYFVNLIDSIIENMIEKKDISQITLAAEYIDQKLIEGAEFDPNDSDQFSNYGESVQEYVEELIEGHEFESQALIKHSYDLVKSTIQYDRNWLATPADMENMIRWSVLDKTRSDMQEKLNSVKLNKEEDILTLKKLVKKAEDRIINIAYVANTVFAGHQAFGTFSAEDDGSRKHHFITTVKYEKKAKGVDSYRSWDPLRVGKTELHKEPCIICESNNYSFHVKRIHIRSWEELVFVLGLKGRMQLPKYYRSYRTHDCIPYTGNSILDNTHPYSDLDDPCSRDHVNGMCIEVYSCGKCDKKRKDLNENRETALIELSEIRALNKVVSVSEMKEGDEKKIGFSHQINFG